MALISATASTLSSPAEEVRARYARKLPSLVEELSDKVRAWLDSPGSDIGDRERLRRAAHKLAGTSGSYGHEDVSRAAQQLELALGGDSDDFEAVGRACDHLGQAVTLLRSQRPTAVADETSGRTQAPIPRVILIAPDEAVREQICHMARRHFVELRPVSSLAQARLVVQAGSWEGIIADVESAGGEGGFEELVDFRDSTLGATGTLAVMSSSDDIDTQVAAAHAGVDVFLRKPLSNVALRDAITTIAVHARTHSSRVLVVDDDEDFLAVTRAILEAVGMDVRTMTRSDELVATLLDFKPHALLLDWDMPRFNGVELCAMLRANQQWKDLPVLFVTSRTDSAARTAAFDAGCDDYFLKPLSTSELCARVRSRVERVQMLRARADVDSLTGLSLRHVFLTALEARLSEANRRGSTVAFCLLDLDHFKAVNDTHGHLAGDRALVQVGQLLSRRFRGVDLRCRWGGEEFALALPGSNSLSMRSVMERLLEELSQIPIPADDGSTFHITFSAGVAEYPADGATADDLVKAADARLYAAKEAGRARVCNDD